VQYRHTTTKTKSYVISNNVISDDLMILNDLDLDLEDHFNDLETCINQSS